MKKYPRLPVGYGTIRRIGGKRSKPYAVHPPATERDPNTGLYIRPPALCYVSSWYVGMSVLSAYHAGNYHPGDEKIIEREFSSVLSEAGLSEFCQRLLSNFAIITGKEPGGKLLKDVYAEFYEWKFGVNAPKELSHHARRNTAVAFSHLDALHDRPIAALTLSEMQDAINSIPGGQFTVRSSVLILKQLFDYAIPRDYCQRNLADYLVVPKRKETQHHDAFTDEELSVLWMHTDDPIIAFVLIMCYSGFRLTAYDTLKVDLKNRSFTGGIKTAASRGRTIPMHSAIVPLVEKYGAHPRCSQSKLRIEMEKRLPSVGVRYLSPHSCRHTFSRLCESYGVNENDRKRMLGHSLGDITNSVYGHRSLEELRSEIEKICVHLPE